MRFPVLAALLLATPVVAQETLDQPAYQDDRSSATAVIQSFYNAINRKEYVRAWSYYAQPAEGTAETQLASFSDFEAGYANTQFVTLTTGEETSEGAAGSLYYTVPVAIDALDADGTHAKFAGCFTLRLVQPANQATPPFQPLHIEKGELAEASGELESILPASCE